MHATCLILLLPADHFTRLPGLTDSLHLFFLQIRHFVVISVMESDFRIHAADDTRGPVVSRALSPGEAPHSGGRVEGAAHG